MKRFNLFASFAVTMLVAIMTLTITANAQSTDNTKELKLKTTVASAVVKNRIETITNSLKGVSEAEFNIAEKTLTVKYSPDEINSEMLMYVLKLVGYDTVIAENKSDNGKNDKTHNKSDAKEIGSR